MEHVLKQCVMIITLVKQNDKFSRGLKHALENNHQRISEKDFKIICNGF